MSFLAPFFLLGAAAIAAPVIFHLIRRTNRDRVLFSTLMFLAPTPPRLTRRSRLEHYLLLFLRCLVLALLALGFARPFLKDRSAPPDNAGLPRRTVILVDASASMRRDNLWADARDKAAAAIREAAPGDDVSVLAFSRRVTPVFRFDEWKSASAGERAALAIARLGDVKPDWSSTHLGQALVQAAESLAEADATSAAGPRRIVLISDIQEGGRLDTLQGYDWPKGIELVIEAVKPRTTGNAGIQWVAEAPNAESSGDPAIRVRVSNTADSSKEQLQVGWADAAGKGFSGKPLEVYVPPGQSRVVAVPVAPGTTVSNRILLRGDVAEFDNSIAVVPPETVRSKVLYLGKESADASREPLYFLRRAFPDTRRQSIQVVSRPPGGPLTVEEVSGAALVVVTDPLPDDRAGLLRAQVQSGRTLLVAPRTAAVAGTLAQLLGLGTLAVEEAKAGGYALLADLDFRHPLLAPFADPRFSDFTKIHFWKHRRLDAAAIPGAHVVARFDSGAPALIEVPAGRGRIVVLTSGWHPDDSQLALSTKFVPLLFSVLDLAGSVPAPVAQYLVDDIVPLPPHEGRGLTVQAPDGTSIPIPAGATNFTQAVMPGIYSVAGAQPPVQFAVNVDPAESRTAPMALDDLEKLGAPVATPADVKSAPSKAKQALLLSNEAEARQKLWRWFLVGALALLLIETALAGWTVRQTTNPEGATP